MADRDKKLNSSFFLVFEAINKTCSPPFHNNDKLPEAHVTHLTKKYKERTVKTCFKGPLLKHLPTPRPPPTYRCDTTLPGSTPST